MNDDPDYAKSVLPEAMADRLYELLDPIVDHNLAGAEEVNQIVDWIDSIRTESRKDGREAAEKALRTRASYFTCAEIEKNRPAGADQLQWMAAAVMVFNSTFTYPGRIEIRTENVFWSTVRAHYDGVFGVKAAS